MRNVANHFMCGFYDEILAATANAFREILKCQINKIDPRGPNQQYCFQYLFFVQHFDNIYAISIHVMTETYRISCVYIKRK